ncbi:PREDICTED: uncharacterized protein LOC109581085 isoform X2 [Amphimedon queenslandica]|uniref:Uncharacterized protein n=1 Tax=Amphimedon queenslandica TaxID=400682 RepID=A0AAN0J081_AMPQE|nr:PREDICTED: uncharacterized protein LOC109581085 isoform X2 [Amphimedon queenslandica]|eukprot:XP_019850419.1 PREDICTED: uncharacterized protein LOC109581085 isoform X2 [Amphimedon queenslandica]
MMLPDCLLLLAIIGNILNVKGQEPVCANFMDQSLVTQRAQEIGNNLVGGYLSNELRMLQEYEFDCITNITSLFLGIDVRIATDTRTLFPSIQIFRRNSVNFNQLDLIDGSERVIYYSTSNVSTTGLFEYALNPPMSITHRDLLAVSQPLEERSVVRLYYVNGVSSNSESLSFGSKSVTLNPTTTNQSILIYPVLTDRNCLISNLINTSFVIENSLGIHESQIFTGGRQYLYPEMIFSCNRSVVKWIYAGTIVESSDGQQPELQIWRKINSEYVKVGSSLVNANTVIGTNLYEFVPRTPLQFQESDIFGVHIPPSHQSQIRLHEQVGTGPKNIIISTSNALSQINASDLMKPIYNNIPLITAEIGLDQPTATPMTVRISCFYASSVSDSVSAFNTMSISKNVPATSTISSVLISSATMPVSSVNPSNTVYATTLCSSTSVCVLVAVSVVLFLILVVTVMIIFNIFFILIWKRRKIASGKSTSKSLGCNDLTNATLQEETSIENSLDDLSLYNNPLYMSNVNNNQQLSVIHRENQDIATERNLSYISNTCSTNNDELYYSTVVNKE